MKTSDLQPRIQASRDLGLSVFNQKSVLSTTRADNRFLRLAPQNYSARSEAKSQRFDGKSNMSNVYNDVNQQFAGGLKLMFQKNTAFQEGEPESQKLRAPQNFKTGLQFGESEQESANALPNQLSLKLRESMAGKAIDFQVRPLFNCEHSLPSQTNLFIGESRGDQEKNTYFHNLNSIFPPQPIPGVVPKAAPPVLRPNGQLPSTTIGFSSLTPLGQSPFDLGTLPKVQDQTFGEIGSKLQIQKDSSKPLVALTRQPKSLIPEARGRRKPTFRSPSLQSSEALSHSFERNKVTLVFKPANLPPPSSDASSSILGDRRESCTLIGSERGSVRPQGLQGAQLSESRKEASLLPEKQKTVRSRKLPTIEDEKIESQGAVASSDPSQRKDLLQINSDLKKSFLSVARQHSTPPARRLLVEIAASKLLIGRKRPEQEAGHEECAMKQLSIVRRRAAQPDFHKNSQIKATPRRTSPRIVLQQPPPEVKKRELKKEIKRTSPRKSESPKKAVSSKRSMTQQRRENLQNRRKRGLGKKTIQKTEAIAREMAEVVLRHKEPDSTLACTCSKTKCLRLYCACFTRGYYCDDRCNCKGCHNEDRFETEIREARRSIKQKDERAFEDKIIQKSNVVRITLDAKAPKVEGDPSSHVFGCGCRNSRCQKKYCECYQSGVPCQPGRCKCIDCHNQ